MQSHTGGKMPKLAIFTAAMLLVTTSMSFAQHKHPIDVAKIDAALPKAQINSAQRAQVISLRNEGERLHYAGKHGAAEVALEKAKGTLHIH